MKLNRWIDTHTKRLDGKRVAVTGTTGGIGTELCRYLAALGADLILLNRNPARSQAQKDDLLAQYPNAKIDILTLNLEDFSSVKSVAEILKQSSPDVFIHNAGAYSIPRKICDTGYDNVFQINFVSPYYIIRELLPCLQERGGSVIAVGSIAHNYSKIDPSDPDFSTYRAASKVYGNAKRHLMYGLLELFSDQSQAHLAITHPGITFTNITAHYPKVIFALIKHPMKIIFMKPKKATLCVLDGLFEKCTSSQWIGPRVLDIWGLPKKKRLKTASFAERKEIAQRAEKIYAELTERGPCDH